MSAEKEKITIKSETKTTIRGYGIQLNDEMLTRIDQMVESYEQRVAARLNKSWAGAADGRRVIALAEYYRAADAGFAALLRARGHADAEIGQHAGLADTALSMAVDPLMVRRDAFDRAARGGRAEGVSGDPRAATAQLGQPGLELIVVNSVAAIRAQLGSAAAAASAPRSTIPRSKD